METFLSDVAMWLLGWLVVIFAACLFVCVLDWLAERYFK
jgi:hypothetical protein